MIGQVGNCGWFTGSNRIYELLNREIFMNKFQKIMVFTLFSVFALINTAHAQICAQVITSAMNPVTGVCQDFPTPCDVPVGWQLCRASSTTTASTTTTTLCNSYANGTTSYPYSGKGSCHSYVNDDMTGMHIVRDQGYCKKHANHVNSDGNHVHAYPHPACM